jgi:glycosyltransferase involved in cell wall biosynthesis
MGTNGNFEVVVADDGSSDETRARLRGMRGLTLVELDSRVGFQGAITAAIEAAKGKYLVMLNNDTQVRPGWLQPLVDVAENDDSVGAVGSKLLFPDGSLQEAGSIVWNDATAWNWGHHADPNDPAFNFRREADYASAAALLVRRSAFDEVGGFDKRFAPAYYEDVDLCFKLRGAGYKVTYQPESVVVHIGSHSHLDANAGLAVNNPHNNKRCMEVNRPLFSAKWATVLDHHRPNGTSSGFRGGRSDSGPFVLICDAMVPSHDTDAGGLRMTFIANLLHDLGCHVTLLPHSGLKREPYTTAFQRGGVEVMYSPWGIDHLADTRTGLYDLVILSRPDVGEAFVNQVRRAFPSAVLIYDTVDLHHRREVRRIELDGGTPGPAIDDLRRLELRLMRNADMVSVVSDEEATIVRGLVPTARTVVLPTVHELPNSPADRGSSRDGIVFIGGFQHPPNVDAMLWFVDEILPLIREHSDAHLTILGSHPPGEIEELRCDHISVTGYIPDVDPYFHAASVFVAPIRYGAGVKGKVGHAMALGLPVVATTVGTEGLGVADGVHALVRDDPRAFAEAVIKLGEDPELWKTLSVNASQLIDQTLSPTRMRERLERLLQAATVRL